MKKNRGNKILGSINDTEAFPMDDLGNRVGQVTQRDGVGNAHRDAASRHGVLRPDITATNRIHLGVNDVRNSVDELTNRYTAIDANSLAYDDAGSLTQDKDGYRTTYDYENRPVRIAKLDGQTEVTVATFAYDALGRRIRKVDAIAGTTSLYYYSDNWQVLAEYDGSGVLQASYAYGNYIDEVLLMRRGGADYFYLHDHLYSPAALLSSSGAVVERYEYDVYGTCHIQAPDFSSRTASLYGNAFLFQGHMQDSLDSGSLKPYDFRYRAYDSFAGRWMQQDPLQYVDGLNLYQYVKSNCLRHTDPQGLRPANPGDIEGGEYPPLPLPWVPVVPHGEIINNFIDAYFLYIYGEYLEYGILGESYLKAFQEEDEFQSLINDEIINPSMYRGKCNTKVTYEISDYQEHYAWFSLNQWVYEATGSIDKISWSGNCSLSCGSRIMAFKTCSCMCSLKCNLEFQLNDYYEFNYDWETGDGYNNLPLWLTPFPYPGEPYDIEGKFNYLVDEIFVVEN